MVNAAAGGGRRLILQATLIPPFSDLLIRQFLTRLHIAKPDHPLVLDIAEDGVANA